MPSRGRGCVEWDRTCTVGASAATGGVVADRAERVAVRGQRSDCERSGALRRSRRRAVVARRRRLQGPSSLGAGGHRVARGDRARAILALERLARAGVAHRRHGARAGSGRCAGVLVACARVRGRHGPTAARVATAGVVARASLRSSLLERGPAARACARDDDPGERPDSAGSLAHPLSIRPLRARRRQSCYLDRCPPAPAGPRRAAPGVPGRDARLGRGDT
jgi:hypothetical protein